MGKERQEKVWGRGGREGRQRDKTRQDGDEADVYHIIDGGRGRYAGGGLLWRYDGRFITIDTIFWTDSVTST